MAFRIPEDREILSHDRFKRYELTHTIRRPDFRGVIGLPVRYMMANYAGANPPSGLSLFERPKIDRTAIKERRLEAARLR
jgi:hypothetical protein